MVIGIDFDNTIVCYDQVFYRVALEQGLIPPDVAASKSSIRNHLRAAGKEDLWTALQGMVYGTHIDYAAPFPGVMEFFKKSKASDATVIIISHKTEIPYLGTTCNLHEAADRWLQNCGFYDRQGIGLLRTNVYFEITKAGKLNRIAEIGCDYFIDDLPEFLDEAGFKEKTRKVLFDPNGHYSSGDDSAYLYAGSWARIQEIVFVETSEHHD